MREFNIKERRPVWVALSDLFLDTDVSLNEEWIIKTLSKSPYSVPELENILINEVAPVCGWNLMSAAGEWEGFGEKWLEEKILKRRRSPFRWFHRFNTWKTKVHLYLPYWKRIKESIAREKQKRAQ